ncbi:unnamed protein product [Absidia cylindrospora]
MSLLENETLQVDTSAWPSSYYRKSQRVDLEKFFQKVQQEQQEQQQLDNDNDRQKRLQRKNEGRRQRQVTFHPDPPTVFVYEPEYDTTGIQVIDQPQSSKDIWPSYARRPPHRLIFVLFAIRTIANPLHPHHNLRSQRRPYPLAHLLCLR